MRASIVCVGLLSVVGLAACTVNLGGSQPTAVVTITRSPSAENTPASSSPESQSPSAQVDTSAISPDGGADARLPSSPTCSLGQVPSWTGHTYVCRDTIEAQTSKVQTWWEGLSADKQREYCAVIEDRGMDYFARIYPSTKVYADLRTYMAAFSEQMTTYCG